MEENIFNVNLADMDSVFNNKTLRYRINAFAYACKMEDIKVMKNISVKNGGSYDEGGSGVIFSTDGFKGNKRTCEGPNYFIAVNKYDKGEFGKNIVLSGHYDNLSFSFINYYDNKKLNRKVVELPFKISLAKLIDNDNYKLDIETVNGYETKITFSKYREHKKRTISYTHDFYVNILDFSLVLKLVKSFAYNPELVFASYNEVLNNKKITFTNADMKKGIMQDNNLEKPIGKVKKIFKTIID